ncbi:hypothetical protein BJG94_09550 [Rhizobium sp. Td3]|nr:hypothetical protein BJG94_09550 [Rhizobium sp. Td3]
MKRMRNWRRILKAMVAGFSDFNVLWLNSEGFLGKTNVEKRLAHWSGSSCSCCRRICFLVKIDR